MPLASVSVFRADGFVLRVEQAPLSAAGQPYFKNSERTNSSVQVRQTGTCPCLLYRTLRRVESGVLQSFERPRVC